MQRYILIYGTAAGLLVITTMILGFVFGGAGSSAASEAFGYTIMLVALSLIFVAIKRYRDRDLGGVIRFGQGVALGMGIAAVAGVAYVVVWEIHLHVTDFAFINEYAANIIAKRQAAGIGADELETLRQSMEKMSADYRIAWRRLPMTFLEIFPVGAIVALFSAALLRNPRILPQRA